MEDSSQRSAATAVARQAEPCQSGKPADCRCTDDQISKVRAGQQCACLGSEATGQRPAAAPLRVARHRSAVRPSAAQLAAQSVPQIESGANHTGLSDFHRCHRGQHSSSRCALVLSAQSPSQIADTALGVAHHEYGRLRVQQTGATARQSLSGAEEAAAHTRLHFPAGGGHFGARSLRARRFGQLVSGEDPAGRERCDAGRRTDDDGHDLGTDNHTVVVHRNHRR